MVSLESSPSVEYFKLEDFSILVFLDDLAKFIFSFSFAKKTLAHPLIVSNRLFVIIFLFFFYSREAIASLLFALTRRLSRIQIISNAFGRCPFLRSVYIFFKFLTSMRVQIGDLIFYHTATVKGGQKQAIFEHTNFQTALNKKWKILRLTCFSKRIFLTFGQLFPISAVCSLYFIWVSCWKLFCVWMTHGS